MYNIWKKQAQLNQFGRQKLKKNRKRGRQRQKRDEIIGGILRKEERHEQMQKQWLKIERSGRNICTYN